MDDIKTRRKALGWSRATLAEKAALDKRIIQLIELGEWTEDDAQARVDYVLKSAEHGDADIQLDPVRAPDAPATEADGGASPSE